ncbi:hypothetical protein ABBQ32_012312 [Trebouxia sp. C0010 RCD-2024]
MESLWSDLPEQNGQPDHGTVASDAVGPNESNYASSISFSSPGRSEPDSDFATDRAGTKAGHRKPGSSDDGFSDDSTYGAAKRKRRKVQPEKLAKRVRPPEVDNDQTRKLRSALPSEEPSLHIMPSVPSIQRTNGFDHNAMQASNSAAPPEEAELDSDEEQEMDSQSQAVERHLTQHEHAEQLRQVQSMWQMAAILEFLHTFSLHLRLRGSFTPEELEVAIVSETAQTGLLANLHQDLLRGITSRSDLNSDNWAAHFANRLKYQWVSTHLRGSPPFAPLKRHEAHDYAALHASDRVLALKLLCEIRLDKDDLRSAIEQSMKPVKPPSRPPSGKPRAGGGSIKGQPEPSPESTMDVRHEPLGEDANGVMYWYLDLGPEGHTSLTGVRLYKETTAEPPSSPSPSPPKPTTKGAKDQAGAKGKGPKGRGKKPKKHGGLGGSLVAPPAEPSWELLASSTDELQAIGEDLTGQPANAEADIGYQILDDIVPNLVARAEAQEKRARAAAKVAAQLNSVVPDDNGHYGRSRRQRTQVNYNYDEYDKTIKDAIRGGRSELLLASTRPQKDWSRPPPIESRRAGLRGGKPEEQAHSSPDENRPSNDQAGAQEASTDGAGSGSHAESHQQPGPELAGGDARYHVEDFRPDVSEYGDEMQDDANDRSYMQDSHDHHAVWGSHAAAAPMFHRSFAVGNEPVTAVPYVKSGETHHSYFT